MSYYPEFARLVEEALIRLDRSPSWLAQRLDINPSTVGRWLNQGARPRDPETVVRVADVLGLTAQSQELLAAAGFGYVPDAPASLRSGEGFRPSHNLPIEPTPFVGRTSQLAQIGERLSDPDCRLLTVVGPGGIGKTRLAIRAAQEQGDRFIDGACYVDLAPVETADMLAVSVLRALGAPDYGTAGPERRLYDLLRGKKLLLLLDNFEHLMEGAGLLPELLQAAPGVKLLVTSRERLNLREEWLEPLEGLELPPDDEFDMSGVAAIKTATPDLNTFDATRLFLMCMRRLQPGYKPTDEDVRTITAICRLLGGMPLALELAATWTRMLPPDAVLREAQGSLDFLSASLRDVPERHRSIHAVFDHSWSMLSSRECSILRQFSVFRGGATQKALEAVTGASLADLAVLVDKSWLRPETTGRYTMHELVRQYCENKLEVEHEAASGESAAEVRRRHCDFIGAAVRTSLQKINFEAGAYDEIIPELGNLQAAWRYAVETLDSEAGQKIALAFWFVGDVLGWFTFAVQTLEMGAAALEERIRQSEHDPMVARRAAQVLVWIRLGQNDQYQDLGQFEAEDASLEKLAAAVDMLEPSGAELFWQAELLNRHAVQAHFRGDFSASYRLAQQSLKLFENPHLVDQLYGTPAGITFWQAEVEFRLAMAAMYLGDYANARLLCQHSIALSDDIGEGRWQGYHLSLYAELALIMGDLDLAERLAEEGLRLVRSFSDRVITARLLVTLAYMELATGSEDEAQTHLLASLETSRQCGYFWGHMRSLTALGNLALHQGAISEASRNLEEAVTLSRSAGRIHNILAPGALLGLGWVALAEGNLVEARETFRELLVTGKCAAWEKMEAISGLAEVLAREGDTAQAVALLEER